MQPRKDSRHASKIPPLSTLSCKSTPRGGFTLVELSIVIVIIGLIVGGILTGRDLIAAAEIRGQISQIEKYQTAVNTFKVKYGYLPGDIPEPAASGFGFVARGAFRGQGDGNGIIEGNNSNLVNGFNSYGDSSGESAVFWRDLSQAGLINDSFTLAANGTYPALTPTSSPNINAYLPTAKAGGGNIYVWSLTNGSNYYSIQSLSSYGWGMDGTRSLKVQYAYNIDQKIDDGLPQSGNVLALYWATVGTTGLWWAGGAENTTPYPYAIVPYTTATSASANSCFDNGGVVGAQKYSVGYNGGNSINCDLTFKFQ